MAEKLEASEIMTAGALFFPNRVLDNALSSNKNLGDFMLEAKKKVETGVEFGSSRDSFLAMMKTSPEMLKELVVGISAAKAIKKWVTSTYDIIPDSVAEKVFMTGQKWPTEVDKFQVDAFGFTNYNSSDLIYKPKSDKYFGISLKKKLSPQKPDPTLINKAFDTILQGPGKNGEFDKIKDKLTNVRIKYFAKMVRKAHDVGILYIDNIDNLPDEELFYGKNRDKTIFARPYPNTKGSLSGGYDNDKAPDAMRSFLNADLAKKDNELFKSLVAEMEKKSDIFADSLINLVLKTNLYSELDAKNLGNYTFGFALVTGIGEIKQGKPFAYEGKAYDLYTVLDGLSQLKGNKEKYQIKVNMDLKEATNAAKTYFTLSKKQTPILNLELRYKGDKTPQPQFLGTISQEFINILMKSPLIKKNG
tara:strand:+ start:52 stop:1305 length:1254 start_codon:yes stop_codon:yes gene_type:complete